MDIVNLAWAEGWQPDPDLALDEWADEHIVLTSESSSEPGRFRTDRTPYLRGPMRELSPTSTIERILFMAGAQVGKSQCLLNWLGYVVHYTPGPTLVVQPTVDLAKRFSKQRVQPMIDACDVLRDRVAEAKSRDSSNTQLSKEFPGGILVMTGANSAASLRSMPVRFLMLDEVDAYPVDLDGEGDPVSLAEKRTATFARRKILLTSTPTDEETSRIYSEYRRSDMRRFFVPCPHCDEMQWLRWRDDAGNYCLQWQEGKPHTAAYACQHCGTLIEERFKTQMLAAGEWRATAKGDGRTAGFQISSLYSPLGWKSWGDIAREFLHAKASPELLKTWMNTVLGEPWKADFSKRLDRETLAGRCLMYARGTAPSGALIAVAGVDVQDDRLAVVIRAFGRNEESWLISHGELFGDTLAPAVWAELDEHLLQPIPLEGGGTLKVRVAFIDSGDGERTHTVYDFTRKRRARMFFPVKGMSTQGRPALGKPTRQDVKYDGKVIPDGVELYPLGVDTIKALVVGRITNADPAENKAQYHWHEDTSDQYFDELTAEKQKIKYRNGRPIRFWTKADSARNEAFDCEVYAYAALLLFFRFNNPATIFDKIERGLATQREIETATDDGETEINADRRDAQQTPAQRKKARAMNPNRRRNFATSF